jgi:glycosyltransferase involved in cell wall biosynthesis
MRDDKVSIIIPLFNKEKYLFETISSIINQSYQNYQIIIVDDGSTDNSRLILESLIKSDSRFFYCYQKNSGVSAARNKGLKLVTGNYIMFLDSDDTISPSHLQQHLNFLKRGYTISINDYTTFNPDTQESVNDRYLSPFNLDPERPVLSLIKNWEINLSIPCHCVIFDKNVLDDIIFDESLSNHEDWLFWIKLFGKKNKINFINQKLSQYRINSSSLSINKVGMTKGYKQALYKIMKYLGSINDNESKDLVCARLKIFEKLEAEKKRHNRRELLWNFIDTLKTYKRFILK